MTSPFEGGEFLTKRNHPVDPDLSFDSLHHTLGHGATQAAPGNHFHNIEEIRGFEETTVLTDHQQLTNRGVDAAHVQYVLKKGDTMTGRLTVQKATYPELFLHKVSSLAGLKVWGFYISGVANDPATSLTVSLKTDDGATTLKAWRFFADGTFRLSADPINAMDAATKQYVDRLTYDGTLTIPQLASNATTAAYSITFPAGRFSAAPIVMVSVSNSRINSMVVNPTTIGADLYFSNWSPAATAGTFNVNWIAFSQVAP